MDLTKKRFSVNRKTEFSVNGNRGKRFSFANTDLNNYAEKDRNNFNIIINKSILRDNSDGDETLDENEPKRIKFHNYNAERNATYFSPGHSLANSTRNINNFNKQFIFNNECIGAAENQILESKKDPSYDYSNHFGIQS